MALIKVPKTPKKAFNSQRRPSTLLLRQIEHLQWAVLPASQRKPRQLSKRPVKTEGQAAERVGQLTKMVLAAQEARSIKPDSPVEPIVLPPLPPVPVDRRARRRSARRKS